jgi:hypothetical protein
MLISLLIQKDSYVRMFFESYELQQIHGSRPGLAINLFLPWFRGQDFLMYKPLLALVSG